jgi:CobQ-like glutamine amidotransferase family enzyme
MLGTAYSTAQADIPGLGLLDLCTEAGERRFIGNVAVRATVWGRQGTLVGFENHAGRTLLGPSAQPLGTVLAGAGNNGQDGSEGAVQGSVLGTYLHGPVLPRNPWFADLLLERALARRHGEVALGPLDDRVEGLAHDQGLALARRRRAG